MRVTNIVRKLLGKIVESVHRRRLASLLLVVGALVRGGRLSLTALGRRCEGQALTKHKIKRVDRLLGNRKLHREKALFCRAIAEALVGTVDRPLVLIDWTEIGRDKCALVAAVPMDGRAIPIYFEVHRRGEMGARRVHEKFLRILAESVMPEQCRPILVTDAGFQNPWVNEVKRHGWDFITRANPCVKLGPCAPASGEPPLDNGWIAAGDMQALQRPRDLGRMTVSRENPLDARIVVYKVKAKRARPRHPTQKVPSTNTARKAIRMAMRASVLVTSVTDWSAARIVRAYRTRFVIEEMFRDAKNHRYGWSLRHARSARTERFDVLLLIAAIAMLVVNVCGAWGELRGLHRGLQANSLRHRRVLSLFVLGRELLIRQQFDPPPAAKLVELVQRMVARWSAA